MALQYAIGYRLRKKIENILKFDDVIMYGFYAASDVGQLKGTPINSLNSYSNAHKHTYIHFIKKTIQQFQENGIKNENN